ncbi:sugar phosphate isomerase/epimerase family protein [Pseudoroseomonas cervicalis]|uniref:AP endonuclease, family 2 n=1 Tax=Pseudoroseomonas cervicalis ATCC 49957 TaxID=525371 RepID=D5RLE5_9PROT|nr:sugar phosphate isomerase/epimerase family protein [Pseudoroseomonas cervicalis]EFH11870.1 AP endonuclease, family 2 [Pseudoroseomonas cervicalis ATCC 49957]
MSQGAKPVLGAALTINGLTRHRDWILDRQRDLEIQDFHKAEVLDGDWRPQAERLRALLDGHTGRVGLHGPFWGFKIDSHDPEIRAVVRRRLLQGLEACEALGATQMVIHSPYTTWDHNNLDAFPGAREQLVERVQQTLREVVARAEAIGCTLVIENIEDKDPRDRIALAASFNSPSVKVSLDTGHAHYAHVSTGAPPVDFHVLLAGGALEHVHVQDTDGHADRHWRPGQGSIGWHSVFAALATAQSSPRLILELRDSAEVPAGAAYLQSLGLAE